MITRLDQLTMAQFIDLSCGKTEILISECEKGNKLSSEIPKVMGRILYEYCCIADKAGAKRYLAEAKRRIKTEGEAKLLTMCNNLVGLGLYDEVRIILAEYGIKVESMSDQRVAAEVSSRLERARRAVEKIRTEEDLAPDEQAIRKSFDGQTATLMAHFKFQIDTSTMKATIYAHLVDRYNREVEAQISAMKRS